MSMKGSMKLNSAPSSKMYAEDRVRNSPSIVSSPQAADAMSTDRILAKSNSGVNVTGSAIPRSSSKEHIVAINENDIMGNISVEVSDGSVMEFSFSSKTTARVSEGLIQIYNG